MAITTFLLLMAILLLSSIAIAVSKNQFVERNFNTGISSTTLALFGSVYILFDVTTGGAIYSSLAPLSSTVPDWLQFDLYIDRLSAIMMILISAISVVLHVFSKRYLQGDSGYSRFFSLLGLMTFVLLAMVTSGSMFMLMIWWFMVSWLLYLLLNHNIESDKAAKYAYKTFAILRMGDIALLCGVILTYQYFGTLQFPTLFERVKESTHSIMLWTGGPEISVITAITLLLLLGAMAKSAQLPLHMWLPDTMDAPTPVSALMHAGIVNAGGFLINRLAPIYGMSSTTLHIAFIIGLLTTLVGTIIMLTRSDVKTKLGFSTMGQMGFMIMECGLGAFALAIFHLIAHGIFKATLFLNAGNIVHKVRKDPPNPEVIEKKQPKKGNSISLATGIIMTLILPLAIILLSNQLVDVDLSEHQGLVILLYFAWVTSSQAMLSLYALKTSESWKVASGMVLTVCLIVVTYIWATESFTYFLYPSHSEVSGYYQAAAFPTWVFNTFVGAIVILLLFGWYLSYSSSHRDKKVLQISPSIYMHVWNGLYFDRIYAWITKSMTNTARQIDALVPDWLP